MFIAITDHKPSTAQYFSKVTVLELGPNSVMHFFPSRACVWTETY